LSGHLLVIDAICLRDRRERVGIAADADQARIEARQIVLQHAGVSRSGSTVTNSALTFSASGRACR
jgi:hypothetical protein